MAIGLNVGVVRGFLQLDGVGPFRAGAVVAQDGLVLVEGAAHRAGTAIVETEGALRGAGKAAVVASEGSAKLRAAQLGAVAAADRLTQVLGRENATLAQTASAQRAVIIAEERLKATNVAESYSRLNSAAARTPGIVERTASSFLSATKGALGLGAAFGAFEFIKSGVESGKELTDALNQVQAVSRASATEMASARAEAIALGKDLTVPAATAVDAADAILELVKAGFQLPRALQAARPALLLAAATGSNMRDTAKVLGDTMDIWQISGEHAGHAANIIAAATLGASHDLMGFFDEVKQAGPSAQALGIDLDHTAAALTYLAKSGLSTSMGGAAVKTFLTNLTKETPKATEAMQDLGLKSFDAQGRFVGWTSIFDQLHAASGRFGNDKNRFLRDLNAAFGVRSQSAAALFARSTGAAYDEVLKRLESGDLQKAADTMNQGVAAGFRQLRKEAIAAGIDIYSGAEPAVNSLVHLIGAALPAALEIGKGAVAPFVVAWHVVESILGPVASVIGGVLDRLAPLAPVLGYVASAVATMWLAWKGYTIARAAVFAILDFFATTQARAANSLVTMRAYGAGVSATMSGAATEAQLASQMMQAEFLQVGAAATQEAAAIDRAKAVEAVAFADAAAASAASTDAQVAAADEAAAAALAQARASAVAAAEITAAADTAAAGVSEAGAVAGIGWRAMLGPLAAVGIGITALVSLFHKSDTASKEAANAAKAYTEALSSSGSDTTVVDAITKQLKDNGVADQIATINRELGRTAVTGKQFVDAIGSGGKPLSELRVQLEGITRLREKVGARGGGVIERMTPAAIAAQKALQHLNTQYDTLTKETKKDLLDTKAFAGASSSVEKVADQTHVAGEAAKQYAQMMGIAVDKNGVAAVSSATLAHAVGLVSAAYSTASTEGSAFLAALNSFSTSAGTAADRAQLIGATLKAANGDALGYVAALNAGTVATQQLVDNLRSQQSVQDAVSKATDGMAAGSHKNAVAHEAEAKAVRHLIGQIVNLKDGTIDYGNAAAAPLINDLQGLQTAAMNAAQAQYQHEVALNGGKVAADEAYDTFQRLTSGALVAQAQQLGLTKGEAKKLADQYFGMPKDVKTLIEQEGANPVVQVLNQIGQQLSILTGHPWSFHVDATISETARKAASLLNAATGRAKGADITASRGYASGSGPGGIPDGFFTLGEGNPNTWELGYKAGSYLRIYNNQQAKAMTGLHNPRGYAQGSGGDFVVGGVSYASRRAARNAEMRLRVHVDHDLGAFGVAARKVGADVRSVFAAVLADAAKVHLSTRLKHLVAAEESHMASAMKLRDRYAAAVKADQDRLLADRKAFSEEYSKVSDTVRSSFDVTTAGVGADGGRPTAGSMAAASKQQAVIASQFVAGVIKLAAQGLNKRDVVRLAESGPSAWPEVQALLQGGPAKLRGLNADEGSIAASGARLARFTATLQYGAAIKEDTSRLSADQRRLSLEQHSIDVIGKRVGAELRSALHESELRLQLDPRQAARLVRKGEALNKRRGG